MKHISVLVMLWGVSYAIPAQAYGPKNGHWTSTHNVHHPIIYAYSCDYQLDTVFDANGFPTAKILNHFRSALDTWFTQGRSHVRIRLVGNLAGNDPVCQGLAHPPAGTIVLTAMDTAPWGNVLGENIENKTCAGGVCEISSGLIFLYRGYMLSGVRYNHPWNPGADWGFGRDFQGVLTHEVGHALGFQHSSSYYATMQEFVSMRALGVDDLLGLKDAVHGQQAIETKPMAYLSNDYGASWASVLVPPPMRDINVISSPSSCYDDASPDDQRVAIVYAAANSSEEDSVFMFRSKEDLSDAVDFQEYRGARRGASIACGYAAESRRFVVATVQDAENDHVVVMSSANFLNWSSKVIEMGTTAPPAVAWLPSRSEFMIAFSDRNPSPLAAERYDLILGRSPDFGQSWTLTRISDQKAVNRVGLACSASQPHCFVAWTSALLSSQPVTVARIDFDTAGEPYLAQVWTLDSSSYGVGVATNSGPSPFLVWRDKGYNTVLTSLHLYVDSASIRLPDRFDQLRICRGWTSARAA